MRHSLNLQEMKNTLDSTADYTWGKKISEHKDIATEIVENKKEQSTSKLLVITSSSPKMHN